MLFFGMRPLLRSLRATARLGSVCACRTVHHLRRSFSQLDIDRFVSLTGDSNPIHTSTAREPIVPGLLASSLFPALIGSRYPGVVYAKQDLKFVRPIAVSPATTDASGPL